jgi:uncharacterized protein YndB with AHSA1/START domain
VPNEEAYEHLGTVKTWVQDMHPIWQQHKHEAVVHVTAADTLMHFSTEVALPPEIVWDYVIQPEHFNVLIGGDRLEIDERKGGRVDVGSIYQCYHGNSLVSQTVLEWHPFELIVAQFAMPVPLGPVTGLMELRLEATGAGTRLSQLFSKARGPLVGRIMGDLGLKQMGKGGQGDIEAFKAHMEADAASRFSPPSAGVVFSEQVVGDAARASLSPA